MRRLLSAVIMSGDTWAMRHADRHNPVVWNRMHIGAGPFGMRGSSRSGHPRVLLSLLTKKSYYCDPFGSSHSGMVWSFDTSGEASRAAVVSGAT